MHTALYLKFKTLSFKFGNVIFMIFPIAKKPSKYYVSKEVGEIRKMTIFADLLT